MATQIGEHDFFINPFCPCRRKKMIVTMRDGTDGCRSLQVFRYCKMAIQKKTEKRDHVLMNSQKVGFVNDIEPFGKKADERLSVKNANCLRALARVFAC
jgi:hypothetical protein